MDYAQLWESIAQQALNFIVVSALTNGSQQRTVTDMKTDLRTTKEDLMSELKDSRKNIIEMLEKENDKTGN
jgi:hypothetical protein